MQGVTRMLVVLGLLVCCTSTAWAQDLMTESEEGATGPEAEQVVPAEEQNTPESNDLGRNLALGFTLDVLPIAMSAMAGDFGMTGQVWVGIDHLRLRMVGGRFSSPDWLAANNGFSDQRTAVVAGIIDYCFGDHFDEWWVGTGFEVWWVEMAHDSGTRVKWDEVVFTMGGGYIWRFWNNLYLEPWAAVHVPINAPSVVAGGSTYWQMPVSGEISLKLGWFLDL